MKLAIRVKENIARIIGNHFTTNAIVNVFTDSGIKTDPSLYAKWRITLDAFNKIPNENDLLHILEEFCHPLNFTEVETRNNFIKSISDNRPPISS